MAQANPSTPSAADQLAALDAEFDRPGCTMDVRVWTQRRAELRSRLEAEKRVEAAEAARERRDKAFVTHKFLLGAVAEMMSAVAAAMREYVGLRDERIDQLAVRQESSDQLLADALARIEALEKKP